MAVWQDKPVRVQARYIPRYLWTTASIDVFWGEQCILRTGGQPKLTGSFSASFCDGASPHQAELCWGHSRAFRFPYQLRIDGVAVENGTVKVENWPMGMIPALLLATALVVIVFGVFLWLTRLSPVERSESSGPGAGHVWSATGLSSRSDMAF